MNIKLLQIVLMLCASFVYAYAMATLENKLEGVNRLTIIRFTGGFAFIYATVLHLILKEPGEPVFVKIQYVFLVALVSFSFYYALGDSLVMWVTKLEVKTGSPGLMGSLALALVPFFYLIINTIIFKRPVEAHKVVGTIIVVGGIIIATYGKEITKMLQKALD